MVQSTALDLTSLTTDLANRCYDKAKSKMSDRAEMGVALLELTKSLDMVEKRALQLYRFTRAIKRMEFRNAAYYLGYTFDGGEVWRKSPKPSRTKTAASNWLEYSYGWAPMVSDIGNAIDVLQSPVKTTHVSVSAVDGAYPTIYSGNPSPGQYFNTKRWDISKRAVRMGFEVSVTNPNLWLANQLGFINPASVAWELVPYSFVLDWFANINQVIAASTDFYGLTIKNAYTSRYIGGTMKSYWGSPWYGFSDFVFWKMRRDLGLISPVLSLKPSWLTGWARAANAVSLLTLQLKSLK
nr:MAG: maturation protein [Sanya fiers-like virus 52]